MQPLRHQPRPLGPLDALHASPPPDRRPPLEPLELGYKSQHPRALTLSPFAAAAGGTAPHRVKPREREEEGSRCGTGPRRSQERRPDRLQ